MTHACGFIKADGKPCTVKTTDDRCFVHKPEMQEKLKREAVERETELIAAYSAKADTARQLADESHKRALAAQKMIDDSLHKIRLYEMKIGELDRAIQEKQIELDMVSEDWKQMIERSKNVLEKITDAVTVDQQLLLARTLFEVARECRIESRERKGREAEKKAARPVGFGDDE